ncbi:ParA family protein [Oxalobacteraceae bacterium CAVE-383]|nr:ParA family protein [Oxalobacteraceae bacterium CAVE-383]
MMIKKNGKIITFYSYKGGVGRTMALANVAFLAAQNNLRVLVMDWDLEAPGLGYYFRGMLEIQDSKAVKEAPGVLNILWDWNCSFRKCGSEKEFDNLKSRFSSGSPFESCRRSLLPETLLQRGCLDIIGAGSQQIECDDTRSYEEALAHFSWPKFYDETAGGFALKSLRTWAKDNYDVILIDSRTGLADVAGICTMQLPDMVALCFILNRQNIDGVARISGVIRANRSDEVEIRAIPMRVSQKNTPEESDASSRAISELTRIGGFSPDSLLEDFRILTVKASDSIPFYETLAPIVAQHPRLDPLTMNYALLAEELLGRAIDLPDIPQDLLDHIRRRIQPKHATIEYLKSLETADPSRAAGELQRLIESALDSETEETGRLDDEYLSALVDASFQIDEVAEDPLQEFSLKNATLDLLRGLSQIRDAIFWGPQLVAAIEKYLDESRFYLEVEEELELLEELDVLLAENSTSSSKLKRIAFRRRTAWLYLNHQKIEATMQTVGEFQILLKDLLKESSRLSMVAIEDIAVAEADASLLTGKVLATKKSYKDAYEQFKSGLSKLESIKSLSARNDASQMGFRLRYALATLDSKTISREEAANYAIDAVRTSGSYAGAIFSFNELALVILSVSDPVNYALDYVEGILHLQKVRSGSKIEHFYGRQPTIASQFLETATKLIEIIGSAHDPRAPYLVKGLAVVADSILKNLTRRRQTVGRIKMDEITTSREKLIKVLVRFGLSFDELPELSGEGIATSRRLNLDK